MSSLNVSKWRSPGKFHLFPLVSCNLSLLLTPPCQCDAMYISFYSSSEHGQYLRFWSCSLFCEYTTCWFSSSSSSSFLQVYLFIFLGIHEIWADVYMPVEHSNSRDSEKSDNSWNDSISDEEQRSKKEPEAAKEKRGLRYIKSHVLWKKKIDQIAEPRGDGREAESISQASEKVDPRAV